MFTLLTIVLMQFVVSVKAGLVNHVQGEVNVVEQSQVRRGHPVRTGDDGYAEILLTPGAFLRMGENAEAVLDNVELESVEVTINHGPSIIEAIQVNKDFPIHVTTGTLKVDIVKPGLYKFQDGVATVVEGTLRATPKLTYGKGYEVAFTDKYTARKAPKVSLTRLDAYSQARSGEVSRVNLSLASSLTTYRTYDAWLFDPTFGMYTYIPRGNFRSPYGYAYHSAGRVPVYNNNSNAYSNNGNFNNGINTNVNTNPPTVSSTSPSGVAIQKEIYVPPPPPPPVVEQAPRVEINVQVNQREQTPAPPTQ